MLHIRHAHIMTNTIINITENGTQQEAAGAVGDSYSDLAEELLQVAVIAHGLWVRADDAGAAATGAQPQPHHLLALLTDTHTHGPDGTIAQHESTIARHESTIAEL